MRNWRCLVWFVRSPRLPHISKMKNPLIPDIWFPLLPRRWDYPPPQAALDALRRTYSKSDFCHFHGQFGGSSRLSLPAYREFILPGQQLERLIKESQNPAARHRGLGPTRWSFLITRWWSVHSSPSLLLSHFVLAQNGTRIKSVIDFSFSGTNCGCHRAGRYS